MSRSVLRLVAGVALLQIGFSDDSHPRELWQIPDGQAETFVRDHMEPRHAVVVVVAARGSKRHKLLEDLAVNDATLTFFAAFGIEFGKGSSIVMHRWSYPKLTYEGKWTRSAVRAWLQDAAYPPVNMMETQFSPPKYFNVNPYGTVLIVKDWASPKTELKNALEPYAEQYRDKLKFTFFAKTDATQKL